MGLISMSMLEFSLSKIYDRINYEKIDNIQRQCKANSNLKYNVYL